LGVDVDPPGSTFYDVMRSETKVVLGRYGSSALFLTAVRVCQSGLIGNPAVGGAAIENDPDIGIVLESLQ
jgi:hypothetical protein